MPMSWRFYIDQCNFTAATSEAMSSKRKLDATLNPRFKQLGTFFIMYLPLPDGLGTGIGRGLGLGLGLGRGLGLGLGLGRGLGLGLGLGRGLGLGLGLGRGLGLGLGLGHGRPKEHRTPK